MAREEAASAFNRAGGDANYNLVLQPVRGHFVAPSGTGEHAVTRLFRSSNRASGFAPSGYSCRTARSRSRRWTIRSMMKVSGTSGAGR